MTFLRKREGIVEIKILGKNTLLRTQEAKKGERGEN
jgi:hypothetical protein